MTINPLNSVNFKHKPTLIQIKTTALRRTEENMAGISSVNKGLFNAGLQAKILFSGRLAYRNKTKKAPVPSLMVISDDLNSDKLIYKKPKGKPFRTPKSKRNAIKAAAKKEAKKAAKKSGKSLLPEGVSEVKKLQNGRIQVLFEDGRKILSVREDNTYKLFYYDKEGKLEFRLEKKPGRRGMMKITEMLYKDFPPEYTRTPVYEGREVGLGVFYNAQLDKVFPASKYWVGENGKAWGAGVKDYRANVHI